MTSTPVRIVGVVVLIIIIIAAVVMFAFPGSWAYLTAPQVVKDMRFVVGTTENPEFARIQFGSLKTWSVPGYSVVEVGTGGGRTVAILANPDGTTEVFDVTGDAAQLTADTLPKDNIAVSPDGRYIVWNVVTEEDAVAFDVSQLLLSVHDRNTNVTTSYGGGGSMRFLDNDTLFYPSTNGYTTLNLSTGEALAMSDESAREVKHVSYLSRDGVLVMPNVFLPQFDVFTFTNEAPPMLGYKASVPTTSLNDVVYADATAAYGVQQGSDGSMIGKHVFDGGAETVFTFPESVHILRATHQ